MVQSDKRGSRPNNDIATVYLTAYNVVQFFGWTALLFTIISHLVYERDVSGLYESSSSLLKLLQTAAVLEIVHAATGMVRSSATITGLQIFSRVFIVWGILHSVSDSRDTVGHVLLLGAWSLTEAIRYPFYVCQMIDDVPYLLKWARYTFFIILYPAGVAGELLCIYRAMPYVRQSGLYSLTLPNRLNVAFSFYYYLIVLSILYIPIFPQLYLHMLNQRKKALSSRDTKTD